MAILSLIHVMRADKDGVAGAGKLVDQLPKRAAGDGIHAGGRFVQEQNGRLMQNRAAQRQTLLPASGQQSCETGAPFLDAGHSQNIIRAPGPPLSWNTVNACASI